MDSEGTAPLVSVVIPTRNRNEKLSRCLGSVFGSDYPAIEVVVVDDASTEPVEGALSGRFPGARYVRNPKRMLLSCSRNVGAMASKGRYLFFLDDDNVLAKDCVRRLVEPLERSKQIAVSVPLIFYLAQPEVVWTSYVTRSRFPGFYTLHTDIPPSERSTFSFHNSFVVRREVFEELHGFDCIDFPIRFSEVEFAHRLHDAGYLAVINPAAKDWHDLGWSTVHIDSTRAYYTERNRIMMLKRYYRKTDLAFYSICILPFVGAFYLVHHPLSSSDGMVKTAASFLRGTLDGLRSEAQERDASRQPQAEKGLYP